MQFAARFSSLVLIAAIFAGCGKTIRQTATEQLLTSDAVDQAISGMNFGVLAGETVYLDTTYIKTIKGAGFVNADYIISSLRQQIIAANCLLQEKRDAADYVIEARVGALGTDSHDLSYGIPASNALNSATALVPTMPSIPTIPEISVARKQQQQAAAKIGVFAYNRKTMEPVWQSGVRRGDSKSREVWVFGAGPFQSGDIYESPRLAGSSLDLSIPLYTHEDETTSEPEVDYRAEYRFVNEEPEESDVQQAGHTEVKEGEEQDSAGEKSKDGEAPRKVEHDKASEIKK